MLFRPEISALGVFLNFDNERMHPPKYPSDPPGLPGSGSCYHLSSILRTWGQAKVDCEAKGAMLFCPETELELTVVRNFLKTSEYPLFQIVFSLLLVAWSNVVC